MRIYKVSERNQTLVDALVDVWEKSVRATHLFLSDTEVKKIKEYVPEALREVEHLVVAEAETGKPVAFMGAENGRLEMLFVTPEKRGSGIGKQLVEYGIETYGIAEVTVNEQNPLAVGFYEHLGFETYKRTPLDEQGAPYPLLYMRR